MKKLLMITVVVICISCCIYTSIMLNNTKKENTKLKKNIQTITTKIDKITNDNTLYTEELDKLKKKNQSKDKELIIWEKAKEKLKKALS
ncbi:MAG: hypothetical protein IJG97_01965 [Bacilli bacterium]|nr:hypothetical protein [Bacilli bacterium]